MKKIWISILAFIMTVSLLCAPSVVFASEADPAAAGGNAVVFEDVSDLSDEVYEFAADPSDTVYEDSEDPAGTAYENEDFYDEEPSEEQDQQAAPEDLTEEEQETVAEDPADVYEEQPEEALEDTSEDLSDGREEASEEALEKETAPETAEEDDSADVMLEEITLLSTPAITKCKVTESGVSLSWNKVDNASSYIIYCRKETSSAFTKLAETTGTSYSFTPESGILYYYSVCAKNSSMLSSYDQNGTATLYLSSVAVSGKLVRGKAVLSWTPVAKAKGYLIYRRAPGGKWVKIAKTEECKYTDETTVAGKSYEYGVRAYLKHKKVLYKSSLAKRSKASLKVPVTISVKKVESGQAGMMVRWNTVSNAASYDVFRKGTTGGWKKIGKTPAASFVDKNVSPGQKYRYKIAVCDKNGNEGYCGSYKASVYVPKAAIKSLTNNGRYVKLTWESVHAANGYRIYRKQVGKSKWVAIKDADSKTTELKDYTDGYGSKYEYLVRAFIKVGKKTYFSCKSGNCKAATVRMQTPTVLAELYEGEKGFNISWTMIKGATSYSLYRWCQADGWVKLKDLKETFYVDRNVSKGVNYRYKVIACSGTYKSAPKTSGIIRIPTSIDLPESRYLDLGWDVDPRATGGPAYYDSYATDWSGKCLVNKKVWANHNTIYGSTYKPHAGDIIVYGHENEDGRVYQHVDICVKTYDSATGTFGVISGNWGSYFMTSPIAYVDKSWNDYTSNKSWYNTIHNIWQCKLSDTKRNALINSAYLMLEEYQKNPDYVRGQILDAMWIGPNNWCDVFVAYTIYIAR